MKRKRIKRDNQYDWIEIAQKRAYIIQPKPKKESLQIFQTFHNPRRHPYITEEEDKEEFAHKFKPKHFKEKKILNRTFEKKRGSTDQAYKDNKWKMNKEIALSLFPHFG
jgi:hypothetical protein